MVTNSRNGKNYLNLSTRIPTNSRDRSNRWIWEGEKCCPLLLLPNLFAMFPSTAESHDAKSSPSPPLPLRAHARYQHAADAKQDVVGARECEIYSVSCPYYLGGFQTLSEDDDDILLAAAISGE